MWPVKDLIYMGIVTPIFFPLIAFEWAGFLGFFLYCFYKVFAKASGRSKWTIRTLAVLMSLQFIAMRCIFLLAMLVTLPLPPEITSQITRYFSLPFIKVLQYTALYSFAALLDIPMLVCTWQLVVHGVGRNKHIRILLDENTTPKVVIVMPCYNEEPEVLLRTIDSIVDCEYPPSCMHIFLSFDGDSINSLYLNTLSKLAIPIPLQEYSESIDLIYRRCRVTVSRFPHGGKRNCQRLTYRLMDKIYTRYQQQHDDIFVLFIDSDCILEKHCIQNFMFEMELRPGNKRNILAMTGVITSTTVTGSFLTLLQDMEYVHGQYFERSVESACGATTCLPGALTMLRLSAFRNIAKFYFADNTDAGPAADVFDYGKCHLGEDRWLTHLFMVGATKRHQIQMHPGAFCKTEAVQTYKDLFKQRRRWFLGYITNESCMLTDIRLWMRYPVLLTLRLAQNTIRTTALLLYMMMISLATTEQKIKNLPVGFIGVSLGLNWLMMIIIALKLGRYKMMLYPLMFFANPFFNLLYMYNGIVTARKRTWGGPRADAESAALIAPQSEAVKIDESRGRSHVPLMPSSRLEGRFTAARLSLSSSESWFRQANDLFHKGRRDESPESTISTSSSYQSIPVPRRVESIMDPDSIITYHDRQAEQEPAGGRFLGAEMSLVGQALAINVMPKTEVNEDSRPSTSDSKSSQDMVHPPEPRYQPVTQGHQQSHDSPISSNYSPLSRKSFERLSSYDPFSDDAEVTMEMDNLGLDNAPNEDGNTSRWRKIFKGRKYRKLAKKRDEQRRSGNDGDSMVVG